MEGAHEGCPSRVTAAVEVRAECSVKLFKRELAGCHAALDRFVEIVQEAGFASPLGVEDGGRLEGTARQGEEGLGEFVHLVITQSVAASPPPQVHSSFVVALTDELKSFATSAFVVKEALHEGREGAHKGPQAACQAGRAGQASRRPRDAGGLVRWDCPRASVVVCCAM